MSTITTTTIGSATDQPRSKTMGIFGTSGFRYKREVARILDEQALTFDNLTVVVTGLRGTAVNKAVAEWAAARRDVAIIESTQDDPTHFEWGDSRIRIVVNPVSNETDPHEAGVSLVEALMLEQTGTESDEVSVDIFAGGGLSPRMQAVANSVRDQGIPGAVHDHGFIPGEALPQRAPANADGEPTPF